MKRDHLTFLKCLKCQGNLTLENAIREGIHNIKSGNLICTGCHAKYEIVNSIPRFVPKENYASGFGFQWLKHARTQYDINGVNPSEERFFKETRWSRDLRGQLVLEVGSGSGRFTEHALSTGATVVSMDYSIAVEANFASNGHRENLLLFQGDMYKLPLRESSFDRIICIGVLQHTPDVERAFMTLTKYLSPGGKLVIDVYRKVPPILRPFMMKYNVRPLVRGIKNETLYNYCKRYIDLMWPVAKTINSIPAYGRMFLMYVLLIPYYRAYYPDMPDQMLRDWAYLDLFDMLAPIYDSPQTTKTLKDWFNRAGLIDVDVHYGYNGIEGRGTRPR